MGCHTACDNDRIEPGPGSGGGRGGGRAVSVAVSDARRRYINPPQTGAAPPVPGAHIFYPVSGGHGKCARGESNKMRQCGDLRLSILFTCLSCENAESHTQQIIVSHQPSKEEFQIVNVLLKVGHIN